MHYKLHISNGVVIQIQVYRITEFMLLNTIFSCLSQLSGLQIPFKQSV